LNQVFGNELPEGISIHVVYAEPGGNDELLARLAARGLNNITIPVHSDPTQSLLISESEESPLYVKKFMEASGMDSKTSTPYEDYELIQPALAVYDKDGAVVKFWSWLNLVTRDEAQDAMKNVELEGQTVPLVTVRPISSYIVPAIQEDRSVKLAFVMR
jgi:hypothetical protein